MDDLIKRLDEMDAKLDRILMALPAPPPVGNVVTHPADASLADAPPPPADAPLSDAPPADAPPAPEPAAATPPEDAPPAPAVDAPPDAHPNPHAVAPPPPGAHLAPSPSGKERFVCICDRIYTRNRDGTPRGHDERGKKGTPCEGCKTPFE